MPDHIGDIVNISLRAEWCYSIFANYDKMSKSTTLIAPFLISSLPLEKKYSVQGNLFGSRQHIVTKLDPTLMFLQGRYCRDKQNSGIIQLPLHMLRLISCQEISLTGALLKQHLPYSMK